MRSSGGGLCAVLLGFVSSAHGIIYTFDTLNEGPIAGQDGWAAYPGTVVVGGGAGVTDPNALGQSIGPAAASRVSGGIFSFPAPQLTDTAFTVGYDFRQLDLGLDQARTMLQLADSDYGYDADEFPIGIGLDHWLGFTDPAKTKMLLRRAKGNGFYGPLVNYVPGHWYRVRMVIDLTAYNGDGKATVHLKDLTAGGDYALVNFTLGNSLDLRAEDGSYRGEPNEWDRVEVSVANAMIDNIWITGPEAAVPEPSALLLLVTGGLACLRKTQTRGRTGLRASASAA